MLVKPRPERRVQRCVWWSVEPERPAELHSYCVLNAYIHAPGEGVGELPATLEAVEPVRPAAKRVRRVVLGDAAKLFMQMRLVRHTIGMILARHGSTFARKVIVSFLLPMPMADRFDDYSRLPTIAPINLGRGGPRPSDTVLRPEDEIMTEGAKTANTASARKAANSLAREVLAQRQGTIKSAGAQIEEMVLAWQASRNDQRKRVKAEPEDEIFSDTIGCTQDSVQKTWHIHPIARQYPDFVKALNIWMWENLEPAAKIHFAGQRCPSTTTLGRHDIVIATMLGSQLPPVSGRSKVGLW